MSARHSQSTVAEPATAPFTALRNDNAANSSAGGAAALLARGCKASTLRVYEGHLTAWWRWCGERGVEPWPAAPGDLAAYTSELASLGLSPISIQQRVRSVIGLAHERAGLANPAHAAEVRRALTAAVAGGRRCAADPRLRGKTAEFEQRLERLPEGPNRDRDVALLSVLRESCIESAALGSLRWKDIVARADGSGVLELRHLREQAELSPRTMRRLAASRNGAQDDDPIFVNRQHRPLSAIAVGRVLRALTQPAAAPERPAPSPPPARSPQYRRHAARRLLRRRITRDGWAMSDLATALGVRSVLVRRWIKGASTPPAYIGLALVAAGRDLPATPPQPLTATEIHGWVTARRWTLASAALALGVSPSAVSMWMHGKVRVPNALRLALDTLEHRLSR